MLNCAVLLGEILRVDFFNLIIKRCFGSLTVKQLLNVFGTSSFECLRIVKIALNNSFSIANLLLHTLKVSCSKHVYIESTVSLAQAKLLRKSVIESSFPIAEFLNHDEIKVDHFLGGKRPWIIGHEMFLNHFSNFLRRFIAFSDYGHFLFII